MASLTGNKIKDTYPGLLKTTDNAVLGASSEKVITDGEGNTAPLALSQSSINLGSTIDSTTVGVYSNALTIADQSSSHGITIDATTACFVGPMDFSGATVTGLPTGSAGLVSGTGADSLKNADSLVTNAATAAGPGSIALGDGATVAGAFNGIAIGCSASTVTNGTAVGPLAETTGNQATAIGIRACADDQAVAIGRQSVASGLSSVSIGDDNDATAACAIAIGRTASATQVNGIAIGNAANARCNSISIGAGSVSTALCGIAIGWNACSNAFAESLAIGESACASGGSGASAVGRCAKATGNSSTAVGREACSTATGAVALGCGVTAAKAETVTVKELETCVAGGGIYLTTPDGLAQPKLTVDNSSNLLIGGNPVGAAGLESGTGADSMKSAASLTTVAADAAGCNAIAIGNNALASSTSTSNLGSIVIGSDVCAVDAQAIVIGQQACATELGGIAIGLQAKSLTQNFGLAVGRTACVTGYMAAAFGTGAKATAGGLGVGSTAIGNNASAQAICSVALGANVVANKVGTTTVNELETCAAGGGITMKSPDTTEYKVTVDNDGILQINGTPYAPKTSFALERYSGQQSDFGCDTIQASILIPAGTIKAGDIWELRAMESVTGSTGWIYTAFWISSTGTIGTGGNEGVNLGQTQTPDAAWASGYNKAMYVHTADGTGAGTTTWRGTEISDSYDPDFVSGGDSPATWAIDWTVDQYLVSRICIDNAGATYVMHGATLHKIG